VNGQEGGGAKPAGKGRPNLNAANTQKSIGKRGTYKKGRGSAQSNLLGVPVGKNEVPIGGRPTSPRDHFQRRKVSNLRRKKI